MKSESKEMEPKMLDRNCQYCDKQLYGRSDKQFCNDKCRNCYHNKTKSNNRNSIRIINIILKKNVSILEKLMNNSRDKILIDLSRLVTLGFNFAYFTHLVTDKEGNTINFCYDYGYYTNKDICIIIKSD
jgi:hypothetical protein